MADGNQEFPTILGPDARFKGELTFEKGMRVMGHFEGKINTPGRVHIAKEAKMQADVEAGGIVVEGEVQGNLSAGDRIELTQEALAALLGVQRTTVNAVVGALQEEGLLSARRGRVIVVDRAGLKRQACECYSIVEEHFGAVIGPSGSGGSRGSSGG